jgi:adenylate cyclase
VLEGVARECRTLYQGAAGATSATESLQGVETVVAAPVLDAAGRVVGAVYGSRTRTGPRTGASLGPQAGASIGPLEAQVIQMLASTVGAGLARMEQEAEAARLRVQFEQFFSADLARELQKNSRLLEGQEREVTVLFADVRHFSRLAERLGPAETCQLIAEVMEHLTACVQASDGVVVDYVGDGLLAVWNAPANQLDHAVRACRAALAMRADLPHLNAGWEPRLGAPVRLGIGLNTGPALCGNTGSRRKFKYGPLGHTVNPASRVEGATKHFGIPLLITGPTHAQLGGAFATRRLCKVRLAGMEKPVDLYELYAETAPDEWQARRDTCELALGCYEAQDWAGACKALLPLLVGQSERDSPALNLMARAIDGLRSPPADFDGVFTFTAK